MLSLEQFWPSLGFHRQDLVILIPALCVVSFVAAALGFWTVRRLRFQHARAELLTQHLRQMRDETMRRLHFLNAISHDLRTPLNGIALQTHVIETALQSGDNAALSEAIGSIRASSSLAAEILDALLQYARVDLDRPVSAPLRINELLQQTAEPFRAAAEDKALAFSIDAPEQLDLETDREKLQRILANLLDNAVKFTPHGSVTVRVRSEPMPAGSPLSRLVNGAAPSQAGVLVEIADTGNGIAAEDREHIFHGFFQPHNPSRDARLGLGLGLVIAQRLAHQLGGELQCDSVLRKGTTFRLLIPQRLNGRDHAPEDDL